ncbi:hypothetical protein [Chryseobacterium lathyri]|uniref:Uncharacterized protein n=1 Tax=Chryseobacterium lathyri TaxID=395933 RepID=A0A511YFD4_9FLAO|nr:hypothetical protein [Chryseobacterium lathyri]GEN73915.1 hypothetical protein CLA01_39870 [Chryseobacterium lathyri]
MTQRKKLNLKELELQLPAIETNETKIILGGNDYEDGIFHLINEDGDTIVYIVDSGDSAPVGGNNVGGNNANDDDNAGGDDNYVDQGDLDHYYDYDGDGDGIEDNAGDGDNNIGENHNILDGLDLSEFSNLVIDTGNPAFDEQVKELITSNNELADLLEDLLANSNHQIKFEIADLGNDPVKYTLADTTHDPDNPNGSYIITFNSNSFDGNGNYIIDGTGLATDGTNLDNLSPTEELVATIAHELLHVKYEEMVRNAYDQGVANGEQLGQIANDLQALYGDDFRDAYLYFDGNEWQWRDLTDDAQNALHNQYLHEYMHEHDYEFIQHVIQEYRNDFP